MSIYEAERIMKIINEGLSTQEQVILEYRRAIVCAFLAGERVKKELGIDPPKIVLNSPISDSGFQGQVGLDIIKA
jgi:hypothetical protein